MKRLRFYVNASKKYFELIMSIVSVMSVLGLVVVLSVNGKYLLAAVK